MLLIKALLAYVTNGQFILQFAVVTSQAYKLIQEHTEVETVPLAFGYTVQSITHSKLTLEK